jgi:hypothetical protein
MNGREPFTASVFSFNNFFFHETPRKGVELYYYCKKTIGTNRQAIQQVSSLYKVSQGTSPSKAKQNSSKKKRNKKLKKPERYLGENAAYC